MTKDIRLSKVAKELDISLDTIIEFLIEKDYKVAQSPNTEISAEMKILLQAEYKGIPENYIETLGRDQQLNHMVEIFEYGFYIEDKIKIWEYIVFNAKQKIDLNILRNKVSESRDDFLDIIIFNILSGFTTNKSSKLISEIISKIRIKLEVKWELTDIQRFIKDIDKVLVNDIYIFKVAVIMKMEGYGSLKILHVIRPFLSNETIDFINGVGSGRRTRKILY